MKRILATLLVAFLSLGVQTTMATGLSGSRFIAGRTIPLLELAGVPMNFNTTLDTRRCAALRVAIRAGTQGPSILFFLLSQVSQPGGGSTTVSYFDTLAGIGEQKSEFIELPPPVTIVDTRVSGDCAECVIAIYCRLSP